MGIESLLLTTVATVVFSFYAVIRIREDYIPKKRYVRLEICILAILALLIILVREYYRFSL